MLSAIAFWLNNGRRIESIIFAISGFTPLFMRLSLVAPSLSSASTSWSWKGRWRLQKQKKAKQKSALYGRKQKVNSDPSCYYHHQWNYYYLNDAHFFWFILDRLADTDIAHIDSAFLEQFTIAVRTGDKMTETRNQSVQLIVKHHQGLGVLDTTGTRGVISSLFVPKIRPYALLRNPVPAWECLEWRWLVLIHRETGNSETPGVY